MPVRTSLIACLAMLSMVAGCSHPDPVDEAAKAYEQGHALLKDRPDRAIPYFDTAIHLNSKYVAAYNERGMARQLIGATPTICGARLPISTGQSNSILISPKPAITVG